MSVSDDSPCREKGGIVRDAERILWSRGIPVYPSLIRHMQGLTQRGITLASQLRESGIAVIESYPGAAQDILGIPRKRVDLDILRRGLEEFGFETSDEWTHDELDAVTSSLVGYFYLADEYEGIGADDEGYMIIPRWTAAMRWTISEGESGGLRRAVCVLGPGGYGKTGLLLGLQRRLGWQILHLAEVGADAIIPGQSPTPCTRRESALEELVRRTASDPKSKGLIIDGFPRYKQDVQLAWRLFDDWSVISLRPGQLPNQLQTMMPGLFDPVAEGELTYQAIAPIGNQKEMKEWSKRGTGEMIREYDNVNSLLSSLVDVEVIELDETRPVGELEDIAIQRLLSTKRKIDNGVISTERET